MSEKSIREKSMEETKNKLINAARKMFAQKGFSATSMDELTASVGLTRGALYHNFGNKFGLLSAVVTKVDSEMALKAKEIACEAKEGWSHLLAECIAYIKMALDVEFQRIVLLDGPAFLGDPSNWPSQNACFKETCSTMRKIVAMGEMKQVDVEAAARLINGAAMNAALWVAASEKPELRLPKAIEVFSLMVESLRR